MPGDDGDGLRRNKAVDLLYLNQDLKQTAGLTAMPFA
jgi:hypothetical protein